MSNTPPMQQRYQFPYALVKKVRDMRTGKKDWGKVEELIAEFAALERQHSNLQYTCAGLTDANTRLNHENAFMLKLIEKHGIGEDANV